MKSNILGLVILITIFLLGSNTFAAQYTFTPRVTARETYTDNVDLRDKNTEDDFITNVTAGGTFSILGRTSGMDLSFDPGYVWYQTRTEDDTWRLPATLNIWNDFSRRTRLTIFDRFLRTEDPGDDEAVVSEEDGEILAPGDSTVRREREPYWTNYATARLDHQFGTDDSIYGQFLYSLRREDDSGPDSNENDRYAPSAGLTYWFGPQWGTTIEATYTRATFDNSDDYHDIQGIFQLNRRFTRHFQLFGRFGYAYRDNDGDDQEERDNNGDDQPGEGEGDYQVYAPSVGFSYDLAIDSRISLGLGYFYQDNDDDADEQAPFVNADLYKLWNYQRWSARLSGLAGLDRNDFGNERLGFEWFAGIIGNARYDFTRNFYGNVVGRFRYSDVIGATREDSRYRVGAGLGWLPTKWMALTLDYYYNVLSSTGSEDYTENRVWFQVTLQPDKPWRF
jgi:hypothetical protein